MPQPQVNKAGQSQVQISAMVDEDEYNAFIERFPVQGSTSWLIRNAIHHFNKAVKDDPTLQEKVAQAMKAAIGEAAA